MTYDLQKWRSLLEATNPNDYRFNVKKSPREINIEIIEKNTLKAPDGKTNEEGESTGKAHMKLLKRGDNEHWEVASVAAPKASSGVGKELYLLALQVTYPSGLSPDSVGQSGPALNLWNSFLKTHPDVTFEEKEEEVNASADDPFKYVWKIDPNYKSKLDWDVERVEKEEPEEMEPEESAWDPKKEPIDDLLSGIDDYPETFEEVSAPEDPVKEDFQQNVKKNYSKLKFKMIGQGKNTYNVGGKMKKPSYKRSKSAPPGFGGSLE
jgi:hypothetical protein|tara:strand:+ start:1701 stop:2495 length:795 start_codon:yes stop_codon:yes gene_type:complete